MKGIFEIGNTKVEIDFSKGNDISIPLNFNGEQPNTYGVDKATPLHIKTGNLLGILGKEALAILKLIVLLHIVMEHILSALVILQMKELIYYLL